MSIPKILDFDDYNHYPADANPTTDADMQDYMGNQNSVLQNVTSAYLWQPQTAYVVNQEVHSPNLPAGYMAVCTTAGTTGTTEPEWSTDYTTYTDGTVTWTITSLYDGKANDDEVLHLSGGTMSGSITVPSHTTGDLTTKGCALIGSCTTTSGDEMLLTSRSNISLTSPHSIIGLNNSGISLYVYSGSASSTNAESRFEVHANGVLSFNDYPLTTFYFAMFTSAQVTIADYGSVTINYTTPSGYSAMPIKCRTNGWVGSPYISAYSDTQTVVYTVHGGTGTVSIDVMFYKRFK